MKVNKPLIIGAIILIFLLIVSLFPALFTDKNPYSFQTIKYRVETVDGQTISQRAPFKPSDQNIMGSDELGRDIYSFVIYGTRLTLRIALYVTLLRFLFALPLGLLAGFSNNFCKNIIRQANILFSGLPPLLFAVFLLYLNFFTRLDKTLSTIAFIIILTIVGFSSLASSIESTTQSILNKPYIKSEYIIGKSKFEVAIENIMPHIMPEFVVMFFMEVARVLTLQIQLGLFSIFIGNLKILLSDNEGIVRYWNISYEPEWASLLGSASESLRVAPWMVLYPAGAFFISVLGFNMFGEGLRLNLQGEHSMFVPKVRNFLGMIFLKRYRYKWQRKHVFIAIGLVLIILLTSFDGQESLSYKAYIEEVPDRLYIGMDSVDDVSQQLKEEMISLGLKPVYEDYIKTYPIEPMYYVRESSMTIGKQSLSLDKDYSLHSFQDFSLDQAAIFDSSQSSLYNMTSSLVKDKVVLMDADYYGTDAIEALTNQVADLGGLAMIVYHMTPQASIGNQVLPIPLIYIREPLEGRVTLDYKVDALGSEGINVVGMIEGQDQNTSDEVILITAPLNYMNKSHGLKTYNYILSLANAFKKSSDRTIVFAFLDGTEDEQTHGIMDYSDGMKLDPYMHIEYFNFREINYDTGLTQINKEQAPKSKYFGISFFQSLDKTKLDYTYFSEALPVNPLDRFKKPYFVLFHKKGIDSIIFDIYGDADEFYNAFYMALKENN